MRGKGRFEAPSENGGRGRREEIGTLLPTLDYPDGSRVAKVYPISWSGS